MMVTKAAGLAVILALAVGAVAASAQTLQPGPQVKPAPPIVADPPSVADPQGVATPAPPVVVIAPSTGAPVSPAIEYAPVPAEPVPLPPSPPPSALPPRSSRDANRLDTPSETLDKAGKVVEDLAKGDVKALRRGPLLIHGNYCGIGNKTGLPPVDALDAACMHHDACTPEGMPNCACNQQLQREASAIAEDPTRAKELRALAGATAASMAVLICK